MKNVVLIGNPNSGKSSIFNILTNGNQYVGNWAGVTIERKEGFLKNDENVKITDLPGIYSLLPNSPEEVIAVDYFINNKPDLILNIIDSTNIERNLFLTLQILELGIPTIIVLNMFDIVEKNKIDINVEKIKDFLKCNVIATSIKDKNSIDALVKNIALDNNNNYNFKQTYSSEVLDIINKIKTYDSNKYEDWIYTKLLEKNTSVIKHFGLAGLNKNYVDILIKDYDDKYDIKLQEKLIIDKYSFIDKISQEAVKWSDKQKTTLTDKLDCVLLNKWFGIPIFLLIISLIYYVSIQLVGSIGSDVIGNFIENHFKIWFIDVFDYFKVNDFVKSLILDGIINGFCIILTFIPQLTLLFMFLSFLEDCGYMSRIAFIMDKIFGAFGLSGKSFIPMVVGCGCSVPAIMSSRTIENEKERKLTIMLTPFIPCGAKVPVFAFFISIFFANYSWIGSSMYIIGLLVVILIGVLLKLIDKKNKKNKYSAFALEMPSYKLPQLYIIVKNVLRKLKSFIVTGGITICITSSVVWFLQSFDWSFTRVVVEYSILASIGRLMSPIFMPIGFNSWQSAVALLSGIMAKENIILTLSILLTGNNNMEHMLISEVKNIFTPLGAYSFMLFVLLSSPCVATMSAIRKEIGSWKDTLYIIIFQNVVAYVICMLFYQFGKLIYVINLHFIYILLILICLITLLKFIYNKIKLDNTVDVNKQCLNMICNNCPMSSFCKNKK